MPKPLPDLYEQQRHEPQRAVPVRRELTVAEMTPAQLREQIALGVMIGWLAIGMLLWAIYGVFWVLTSVLR